MGVTRKGKLPIVSLTAIDSAMFEAMVAIGKVGVEYGIKNHQFSNQTYNLEDSYGFAVYKNGLMQGQPFITDSKATEPAEHEGKLYWGRKEGLRALNDFRAPSDGWSVVVVAGQVYATFVEMYYGLDVLQGSEQEAQIAASKIFRDIKWEQVLKS